MTVSVLLSGSNLVPCNEILPEASFAPCGYFTEWEGVSQTQLGLAETRTISLDDWAQICF
ncbi:MAG: hypothetical protein ACPGJG_07415 [Candidatus Puniceispirillaceae bacterium]